MLSGVGLQPYATRKDDHNAASSSGSTKTGWFKKAIQDFSPRPPSPEIKRPNAYQHAFVIVKDNYYQIRQDPTTAPVFSLELKHKIQAVVASIFKTGFRISRPLVIYDLETTSLNHMKAFITQAAFVKIYPNGNIEIYINYIKPPNHVDLEVGEMRGAFEVTGIGNAHVRDQLPFSHHAPLIMALIDHCDLMGFNNLSYDNNVLNSQLTSAGFALWQSREAQSLYDVDVMRMYLSYITKETSRRIHQPKAGEKQRSYSLAHNVYPFYMGEPPQDSHDALGDVIATMQVFAAILRVHNTPKDVKALAEKFGKQTTKGPVYAQYDDPCLRYDLLPDASCAAIEASFESRPEAKRKKLTSLHCNPPPI